MTSTYMQVGLQRLLPGEDGKFYKKKTKTLKVFNDVMEMASTTSQSRSFQWEDVTWTIHTFHLPHPTNPQLDKIQIQVSRNVMITQYDFQMAWCGINDRPYYIDLVGSDVMVSGTFARSGQSADFLNHLSVLIAEDLSVNFDEELEGELRIWMDEVEGMEGMTREDNWQLMKNRIKLFVSYDDMMPGTSEQGLQVIDPRRHGMEIEFMDALMDMVVNPEVHVKPVDIPPNPTYNLDEMLKLPSAEFNQLMVVSVSLPLICNRMLSYQRMKEEATGMEGGAIDNTPMMQPVKSKALEKQEARNMELQQRKEKKNKR